MRAWPALLCLAFLVAGCAAPAPHPSAGASPDTPGTPSGADRLGREGNGTARDVGAAAEPVGQGSPESTATMDYQQDADASGAGQTLVVTCQKFPALPARTPRTATLLVEYPLPHAAQGTGFEHSELSVASSSQRLNRTAAPDARGVLRVAVAAGEYEDDDLWVCVSPDGSPAVQEAAAVKVYATAFADGWPPQAFTAVP